MLLLLRPGTTSINWFNRFFDTIDEAITEEKRIKGGNRLAKIKMIESMNPQWSDLWLEDVSKW